MHILGTLHECPVIYCANPARYEPQCLQSLDCLSSLTVTGKVFSVHRKHDHHDISYQVNNSSNTSHAMQ